MQNVSVLSLNVHVPTLSRKSSKSLKNKHGMKPSIFLEKRKTGQNQNIIVRIPANIDISSSPLGVFLTKIISSLKINTLILHSTPNSQGGALMESVKLSTLTAPFTL